MTREEKIELLKDYCDRVPSEVCGTATGCPIALLIDGEPHTCTNMEQRTDKELDEALQIVYALEGQPDALDHPGHYNREGAMECIEEMLLIFGIEETMSFCKLNAWKYRYRAADKGGQDDLEKSDRYLAKYKELKERRK